MKLISFYPGPSRVYSNVPEYLYEAYMDGVLSFNHRSTEFSEILERTIRLLHEKMRIPEDYRIVFYSSATECWEVIAQSLTEKKSFHFYNGAFGEKWMRYARKLKPETDGIAFDRESALPVDHELPADTELIGVTFCETSNGTQVQNDTIRVLKRNNPDKLIAVDATSAMAGSYLDFGAADIWYASVQKCFGLPAGMAVMILSPEAVQRSKSIGDDRHYNSLNFTLDNFEKHQTPYTPNVLDIYLLKRTLDHSKGIDFIFDKVMKRKHEYETFLAEFPEFDYLIGNEAVRSDTVLAIRYADVEKLKKLALESSILLGSGYGDLKSSTFRIANFPAIKKREVEKLRVFFQTHFGR